MQECVGDTLEELWVSYNMIEKLKGINVLRNLKVLYMSNNLVKDWSEFNKLQVTDIMILYCVYFLLCYSVLCYESSWDIGDRIY